MPPYRHPPLSLLWIAAACIALASASCSSGDDANSGAGASATRPGGGGAATGGMGTGGAGTGGAGTGGASTEITVSLAPSRTTGVAPLAVFFDASASLAKSTTTPFHDLHYGWDFGDAGSGTWASGKQRGIATGPIAAHVFETAGTYDVTLVVKDGPNDFATTSVKITVTDPDVFFAGNKTVCFSRTGTFAGCPGGAQQVTTADLNDVESHVGSGKRLLLARGDSWSFNETIDLFGAGPSTLGAYGACTTPNAQGICANAPKLDGGGNIDSSFSDPLTDWRIMDIEIAGPGASATREGFEHRKSADNILLLRLNIYDQAGWFKIDDSGGTSAQHVFIHDSIGLRAMGGKGSNGIWLASNRLSVQGNTLDDSTQAEHVMRIPYLNGGVISHNRIANAAPTKVLIKMHAPEWTDTPSVYSQQAIVSDNEFQAANVGNPWMVTIKPQSCTGTRDERLRDYIVERNIFKAGGETQTALRLAARSVTIRNNLFDFNQGQYVTMVRAGVCNQEPPPEQIAVYNNSGYASSADGVTMAGLSGANMTFSNNLLSAPSSSKPELQSGASLTSTNLLMDRPGFSVFPPGKAADFALKTGSAAIDSGSSVPVFDDYAGEVRPKGAAWNIGAYE